MKKSLVAACIIVFAVYFVPASPAAIKFDNVMKNEKFDKILLDFGNAYYSIRYFDSTNKKAKKNDLKAANALYTYLLAENNLNYDEKLLELLTARCLYNYDELKYGDVEKIFTDLNKAFPEKSEHHWVYGNFLATTGKSLEAKSELEKYMEMNDNLINEYFLEDYAYSLYLCLMPVSALHAITNGGTIPDNEIRNQDFLNMIKEQIKESSSEESYETKHVWRMSRLEDGYHYLYSTMLGISFPCKPSWGVTISPFTLFEPAMAMITIDDFSLDGSSVTISLALMAFTAEQDSDFGKEIMLSSMNIIKKESEEISGKIFEKYICEDLSRYTDSRQGARGYVYSAAIEPGQWSSSKCEHAVDWQSIFNSKKEKESPEKAVYYHLEPAQNRLQEPVTFLIFVDSCNALADETEKLLSELFSKSVFD